MEAQHRQMDYMRRRMGTATAWQPVGGTDGQPLYVPVPQAPYPRPWDKNPQYVYKPAKYIGFQKGDALDRQVRSTYGAEQLFPLSPRKGDRRCRTEPPIQYLGARSTVAHHFLARRIRVPILSEEERWRLQEERLAATRPPRPPPSVGWLRYGLNQKEKELKALADQVAMMRQQTNAERALSPGH